MKIKTIRVKIFVYFFIAATAMIGVYGIIDYNLIRNDMENQMDERLNLTKYMIRDEMDPGDIKFLKLKGNIYSRYSEKFMNMKNITNVNNIFVIDVNKEVVLTIAEGEVFYVSLDDYEISQAISGAESQSPLYRGSKGRYFKTIYLPVEDEKKVRGVIGIEVSAMYIGFMKHYRNSLLIVGVIIMAIAFILSVLISRDISSPIRRLQMKAGEIAKRNFDEDIQIRGEDEIKVLEATFDDMKYELREYIENREKMATAGEFSAGVAHEIRNSLNVLSGYAELIKERAGDEKVEKYAGDILSNTIKMGEFVNNFLTYTKEFLPELQKTELISFCKELKSEFKKEIQEVLEISYDEQEIFAEIDAYLLKKALYNIVTNGYQALDKEEKIIKIYVHKEGLKSVIEIEDNGKGIPEGLKDRIFQPFFTGRKEGIGLGLAISYRIIKEIHKGEISLTSKEGEGTKFIVVL